MMKHLFKRVAALLLSVILVASLITAASADDVIFSIYDADGELIKTLNTICRPHWRTPRRPQDPRRPIRFGM